MTEQNAEHESLKRTALFEEHAASGARLVPFAGWEMPIQYTSILSEARDVRSKAGIFDVSHMGRLEITGADSPRFFHGLVTADVVNMPLAAPATPCSATSRAASLTTPFSTAWATSGSSSS